MHIGCHVSIRHGYLEAAKSASAVGARSFQYFPKNPRSLSVKSYDARDAAACRIYCQEHQLISIAHTAYPTNLAVVEPKLYAATVQSVRNDLEIADACGSAGLVVHFGQYKGTDPLRGYQAMIRMVNEILDDWNGDACLLLENNAGQGGRMGTTLEELTQVQQLLAAPEKVGFCFDTCHAFASGMWRGDNWAAVARKMRESGYFSRLFAVHLNDSVYPTGSYRDRHATIGKGQIGADAIAEVLRTPELALLPIVLETPKPAGGTHREEIAFVKQLISC
ncbi:deoxyribonuclease IV [Brevibacillus sp. H7]|uniref:deoxyribonuclease IV n=1 Tax=Brevibacillus sp. H7 TaxID=3349138 RepID=UPI003823C31F